MHATLVQYLPSLGDPQLALQCARKLVEAGRQRADKQAVALRDFLAMLQQAADGGLLSSPVPSPATATASATTAPAPADAFVSPRNPNVPAVADASLAVEDQANAVQLSPAEATAEAEARALAAEAAAAEGQNAETAEELAWLTLTQDLQSELQAVASGNWRPQRRFPLRLPSAAQKLSRRATRVLGETFAIAVEVSNPLDVPLHVRDMHVYGVLEGAHSQRQQLQQQQQSPQQPQPEASQLSQSPRRPVAAVSLASPAAVQRVSATLAASADAAASAPAAEAGAAAMPPGFVPLMPSSAVPVRVHEPLLPPRSNAAAAAAPPPPKLVLGAGARGAAAPAAAARASGPPTAAAAGRAAAAEGSSEGLQPPPTPGISSDLLSFTLMPRGTRVVRRARARLARVARAATAAHCAHRARCAPLLRQLRLRITPTSVGSLRLQGLRWRLEDSTQWLAHPFRLLGPLLNNSRAQRAQRQRAPDCRLEAVVVPRAPWLGVKVRCTRAAAARRRTPLADAAC